MFVGIITIFAEGIQNIILYGSNNAFGCSRQEWTGPDFH